MKDLIEAVKQFISVQGNNGASVKTDKEHEADFIRWRAHTANKKFKPNKSKPPKGFIRFFKAKTTKAKNIQLFDVSDGWGFDMRHPSIWIGEVNKPIDLGTHAIMYYAAHDDAPAIIYYNGEAKANRAYDAMDYVYRNREDVMSYFAKSSKS